MKETTGMKGKTRYPYLWILIKFPSEKTPAGYVYSHRGQLIIAEGELELPVIGKVEIRKCPSQVYAHVAISRVEMTVGQFGTFRREMLAQGFTPLYEGVEMAEHHQDLLAMTATAAEPIVVT